MDDSHLSKNHKIEKGNKKKKKKKKEEKKTAGGVSLALSL
jgi:hypothetical protein